MFSPTKFSVMDTEAIIKFLAGITNVSQGFIKQLLDVLTPERYKSHQIIQSEGQTENRVWYLRSGLARSYIYDLQGQQHTLRFWYEEEVIFSYAGFLKEPSKEYIELLMESVLYSCTYEKLELLMRDYPETTQIAAVINRRFLLKEYERNQLLTLKTRERYKVFKKQHSVVFTITPLWVIASYLHMGRENLSRIISDE